MAEKETVDESIQAFLEACTRLRSKMGDDFTRPWVQLFTDRLKLFVDMDAQDGAVHSGLQTLANQLQNTVGTLRQQRSRSQRQPFQTSQIRSLQFVGANRTAPAQANEQLDLLRARAQSAGLAKEKEEEE